MNKTPMTLADTDALLRHSR